MIHELKIDKEHYDNLITGRVNYQVRDNSRREIKIGDILHLNETEHTGDEMSVGHLLKYTGRIIKCEVTDIVPTYGLQRGYEILHINILEAIVPEEKPKKKKK